MVREVRKVKIGNKKRKINPRNNKELDNCSKPVFAKMITGIVNGKIRMVIRDSFLLQAKVKEAQKQLIKFVIKVTIIANKTKLINEMPVTFNISAARGTKAISGKEYINH